MIKNKHNLTVYHGSIYKVVSPKLGYSKGQKDFGNGFYSTTDKAQAERFAKTQLKRHHKDVAYINQYVLSSFEELNVKEFTDADVEWLRFICGCRSDRKDKMLRGLDAAIGKIADDNTRRTLDLYMDGGLASLARAEGITTEQLCIRMLETEKLKNQICLYTQRSINRLSFVEAILIKEGDKQ